MNDLLASAQPGWRVRFAEEKRAYTIRARGARYLVCTKPLACRGTVLYTVVDLQEDVRGTENLAFGFGAETQEQCEQMVRRLEGKDRIIHTEMSYRNRVPLRVTAVMKGKQ